MLFRHQVLSTRDESLSSKYLLLNCLEVFSLILVFKERTRGALLDCLHTELHKKNIELFGLSMVPGFKQESSKLIGSFKRVLSMGRNQSETGMNRKSNGSALLPVGEEEKPSSVSSLLVFFNVFFECFELNQT